MPYLSVFIQGTNLPVNDLICLVNWIASRLIIVVKLGKFFSLDYLEEMNKVLHRRARWRINCIYSCSRLKWIRVIRVQNEIIYCAYRSCKDQMACRRQALRSALYYLLKIKPKI